jgi:two-component system LytT family response regulator
MSSERLHLLVADDERLARRLVRQYAAACSGIEVVHECADTASLSAALREQSVDAALLDIRMPGRNVFDVLAEVASVHALPLIVFATAYDRYALRAFEVNAVDYLLKPFTEARFRAAMDRLLDRRRTGTSPHGVPTLLRDLGPRPDRLLVPQGKGMVPLAVADITWIRAEGDDARIHAKGNSYLVYRTLTELEADLIPHNSCGYIVRRSSGSMGLSRFSPRTTVAIASRSPTVRRLSSAAAAPQLFET